VYVFVIKLIEWWSLAQGQRMNQMCCVDKHSMHPVLLKVKGINRFEVTLCGIHPEQQE